MALTTALLAGVGVARADDSKAAPEGTPTASTASDLVEQAGECARTSSRLKRLGCFDALFPGPQIPMRENSLASEKSLDHLQPAFWQLAQTLEAQRTPNSGALMIKRWNSEAGFDGNMMMTAPALGTTPPRPLLVVGCVENITRLQFNVDSPLERTRIPVHLKGDHGSIDQTWRLADNGYAVSAGRGLPAIDTLKWIIRQSRIEISSPESAINGLMFDLGDMNARIQPMRALCHW